jgi:hypothetical protein
MFGLLRGLSSVIKLFIVPYSCWLSKMCCAYNISWQHTDITLRECSKFPSAVTDNTENGKPSYASHKTTNSLPPFFTN